jgi:capsular exopolysaccharide synthesis family protein
MRRPCVHRLLGLPNRDGLSNLFRSQEGAFSVSRTKLELPNLTVITSGSLPPNPAELLGSDRMSQILDELRGLVDVIVIDTPPSLVADAQILSGKVDGVLLVIQPGRTHTETAQASLELFKRAGARIIGTVLNRIPRNRDYYYGGYKYYSPYNSSKGYYTTTAELEKNGLNEREPAHVEPVPAHSLLNRVAKTTQELQELVPPDPPKK